MESPALLSEMKCEVERHVDHQLRGIEELDDKSEKLTTVAIGVVGGIIGLFGWAKDRFPSHLNPETETMLGVAVLLALGAALSFVLAYAGFRRAQVAIGPDPAWIGTLANDASWALEDHLVNVIRGYSHYARRNSQLMEHIERRRLFGLMLLLSAVAIAMSAALLVVR